MPAREKETSSHFSPDSRGHYGIYGGRYAPEVLIPALEELERFFIEAQSDGEFQAQLADLYKNYIGRPTPLVACDNLSRELGGARIFLKNEGLCHTGAHKINHCVGQALLAKRMGKRRVIAETGAGQHGVATATVCARFGFDCVIYMGARDVERQRPNVMWMQRLGATVIPVESGGKRLKDAVNAAVKDWITNVRDTHYLLGSCLGPHPFPEMNRYFQRIVSKEIKEQCAAAIGKLPDVVVACVGGGSNAAGAFDAFLNEPSVRLIGVEAGGRGITPGQHAARFAGGTLGVAEGYKTIWLQDENGQLQDTHSVSAGLDYAGIGPLHALLHETGRAEYTYATDQQAIEAFSMLARSEGVLGALESLHALAEAIRLAPTLPSTTTIVVNLSGRAEKDMFILAEQLGDEGFISFLESFASAYRK